MFPSQSWATKRSVICNWWAAAYIELGSYCQPLRGREPHHEVPLWQERLGESWYVVGYEKRDHFIFGVMIFTSFCNTRSEFHAKPDSGLGGASTRVDHVQKSLFYASLWRFTIRYRRLTLASNLDLWSRRPKLSTNQVGTLGLSWPWNGDSLKNSKKSHFVVEVCSCYTFQVIVF